MNSILPLIYMYLHKGEVRTEKMYSIYSLNFGRGDFCINFLELLMRGNYASLT